MNTTKTITIMLLCSCTTTILEEPLSLRPCDPSLSGSDSSSSDDGSSSESTSTTEPAFDCPTIANGDVVFDLGDGLLRTVYFAGVAEATDTSTLAVYWPGTYEWQAEPPTGATPWNFMGFADYVNALVAVPRPDPAAPARAGNPFPWWIVCGQTSPSQCDRDDDFVLAEAVFACVVEQGLADPDRLTAAGMSAGGIMVSHLIERGIGDLELAGAVSWSGGQPTAYQPTIPDSPATAVFVLHGGATDVYCGVGQPSGSCNGYTPYAFAPPSEALAHDVHAAGNYALICNHGNGHNADMPIQGEEFLFNADLSGHPWAGYPNPGVPGNPVGWPGMTYSEWMLRNSNCHYPM
jgi:hypothetical protein